MRDRAFSFFFFFFHMYKHLRMGMRNYTICRYYSGSNEARSPWRAREVDAATPIP